MSATIRAIRPAPPGEDAEDLTQIDETAFPPLIRILDSDPATQLGIAALLGSVGRETIVYPSPDVFIGADNPTRRGCLVLDARLPGCTGLDLQAELLRGKRTIPVIFLTAFGDIRMAVQAMRRGAVDFLEKPYRDLELLDAIERAIALDEAVRLAEGEARVIRARFAQLSNREREVAELVATGMRNRQVATQLGLQEPTVKLHRMWAMRKLGATTLVDLIQSVAIAQRAG
jgi:FixJ family two-component response regulator